MSGPLLRVAVPVPLFQHFDYSLPSELPMPAPGTRVRVPFGPRRLIGVVLGLSTAAPGPRTRALIEILDERPALDQELLALGDWAARYYHEPIGQVLATMLPPADAKPVPAATWLRLVGDPGERLAALPARATAQRELVQALADGPLPRRGLAGPALRRLEQLGVVETCEPPPAELVRDAALALNPEQARAVAAIAAHRSFAVELLHGVTGSGKTEVYLQVLAERVAAGQQALVLVPEIALTPQTLARFRARFGTGVAAYHSGLSAGDRVRIRDAAGNGDLSVLIGTRSALFLPMPKLSLIVVDEEHDASLKQQDGFRYHGRDLAIVRARQRDCPVLLSSATPSLESLHNARSGRYGYRRLAARVNDRPLPRIQLVDLRRQALRDGLSEQLIEACGRHLAAGNQVLLFINRRGFAPVLLCHGCGWIAPCARCDARMTVHKTGGSLRCHHCGAQRPLPTECPSCHEGALIHVGEGTQRVEQAVRAAFPEARVERVDSDRLRRRGALEALLEDTRRGRIDVLVGTQILAKGHDFGRLTLVGMLNVDQALYGSDFRALERMGQLAAQVAGRAGRGDQPGEVLLQTHAADHPMLRRLAETGYDGLCESLLPEREGAGLPPFGHLALLRAESDLPAMPYRFLDQASAALDGTVVEALGPAPAPMERLAGRTRAQLLLRADRRADLQRALSGWVPALAELPAARRVRWSIDVDPADLF